MKVLKVSMTGLLAFAGAALFAGTTTIDPGWAEGDDVTIAAGDTVVVTATTPQLNSLTVAGTLVCSNWTTCVKATIVTVPNKGKITTPCAFTEKDMSNRVWIACADLTIATGGKIDVSDLGYKITKLAKNQANGPGRPYHGGLQGASHGGRGGTAGRDYAAIMPYDDPVNPVQPGSSGDSNDAYGTVGVGGGAVRIDATGAVTVNGSILASSTTKAGRGSAGAGGAILINCATFASENGVIKAEGGNSKTSAITTHTDAYDYNRGPAGGGGMIAIHYGAGQTAAMVSGLTVSAKGGTYTDGYGDDEHCYAGLGTVYFTDNKLIPDMLGKRLWGQLVNAGDYAIDGDLEFTAGNVRFVGEGVSLDIGGDLVVSGALTRLEVGGLYETNRACWGEVYCGEAQVGLTVGGTVTVADGGILDVRAAKTASIDVWGAVLTADAVEVKPNGVLALWSDASGYGAPSVAAGSFSVDVGGLVTAFARGGASKCSNDATTLAGLKSMTSYVGLGPGAGLRDATGIGGAHGGSCSARLCDYGYSNPSLYGAVAYDDEWVPCRPGSGAACGAYARPGFGGGVVSVKAKTIRIDGTINADGDSSLGTRGGGGGSGGTVFLSAKTLTGAETGVITANGGGDTYAETYAPDTSSGAGGRIALWAGREWSDTVKEKRLTRSETPVGACRGFLGAISADGGSSKNPDKTKKTSRHGEWNNWGDDGTVRYVSVANDPGLILLLK